MALSEEQQAQLDELNRLANEPDDDDDFEIEIYSSDGSGARLPYRKGKSWIQKTFGIDVDPLKPSDDKTPAKGGTKKPTGDGEPTEPGQLKLFRQRQSQGKAS